MAKVNPIPDGYSNVTPYLMLKDAARAIEFYKQAFGATETARFVQPDGRIGHADVLIGQGHVMLADEFPEMGFVGPQTLGGTSVSLTLYVEDSDAAWSAPSPPERR